MFEDKLFINKETKQIIRIVMAVVDIDYRDSKIFYTYTDLESTPKPNVLTGKYSYEISGKMDIVELTSNYTFYDDYVKSTDVNDAVIRLVDSGVKIKSFQCKTIDGDGITIKLA